MFTSDKLKMGPFVNPRWLNVLAWAVTAIIVVLNSYLLFQTFGSWLSG
jgi:manganese transport protein